MKGNGVNIDIDKAGIFLAETQSLRLNNGYRVAVDCVDGCLWITQENDLRDIVVSGGQSFTLDRPGLAILYACRPSTISMRGPVDG